MGVRAPVLVLIVYADTLLERRFLASASFPDESIATDEGLPPAVKGESDTEVSAPVLLVTA